jgi:hypothetical protein
VGKVVLYHQLTTFCNNATGEEMAKVYRVEYLADTTDEYPILFRVGYTVYILANW